MDFECKLSNAEMREAVSLNRGASGQVWWVLRNLRIVLILVVLLAVIAANLKGGARDWSAVAGLVAAGAFLIAIRLWTSGLRTRRMAKRINGACERMTVDLNGISTANALGMTTFSPWSQFRGWREGKLVFTVGDAKAFRTIPKSPMTEMQVGQVRGILQTQIR